MYAYAHAPIGEESISLTNFSSGDKVYPFLRGLYGLNVLPNFFTIKCIHYFQKLIEQGFALVYIDDIFLLAHTKPHILDSIEQLHQICNSNNINVAPGKSFYTLLTVKLLGYETSNNTIIPISSKYDGINKLKTPTFRTELMRSIGSMNLYSNI